MLNFQWKFHDFRFSMILDFTPVSHCSLCRSSSYQHFFFNKGKYSHFSNHK